MRPIRLMAGFFTVGVWTFASRILGFVRDALILNFLGTGPLYEAYVIAFRLPNMFRRMFAEGAFNTAFVPIFSKKLQGEEDANGFAEDAMAALATVLILLTLVAMLVMPWLMLGLASGFSGQEKFDVAVIFGRIAFPYILFISLAALMSGVLNASGRFAAAAAAPVLLNALLIATITGAGALGWNVAWVLIWTIPLAGAAQLALVWWAARKAGFALRLKLPSLTPDVRRLAIVAFPAALSGGVMQINLLVGQQVASYFDRAVGWLFAADRLYQLPLGVVGIAIAIVLLPDLSRKLKAGDDEGSRAALSRAGEMALALTIPAAVALIVVPLTLVTVLFERGAVAPQDSRAIAIAVAIYGLGLPAFVLQKILQPLYFAREDTKSPFRYALVAMVVNAVLAIGLALLLGPTWGWVGSAIATTSAGWAMVWLLAKGRKDMGEIARFDTRFWDRTKRVCLASLIMGAVLWAWDIILDPLLAMGGWRWLGLLALVSVGLFAYGLFAHLLGAIRLSEIRQLVRRKSD